MKIIPLTPEEENEIIEIAKRFDGNKKTFSCNDFELLVTSVYNNITFMCDKSSVKRFLETIYNIKIEFNKEPKISIVQADWKDAEGLIDGFRKAIKKLGGHVYESPTLKDSDTYGFIISDQKLTRKQIKDFDYK